MVTSPDGRGVMLIGGYTRNIIPRDGFSNSIYELRGGSNKWIKLEQTLKYGRRDLVVIPIPDKLTICTPKQ